MATSRTHFINGDDGRRDPAAPRPGRTEQLAAIRAKFRAHRHAVDHDGRPIAPAAPAGPAQPPEQELADARAELAAARAQLTALSAGSAQ